VRATSRDRVRGSPHTLNKSGIAPDRPIRVPSQQQERLKEQTNLLARFYQNACEFSPKKMVKERKTSLDDCAFALSESWEGTRQNGGMVNRNRLSSKGQG
jgi:hypothetical protein